MFTTVAKNFAKFLAAYFCLLVAFALSFCVLFPNYQSFNVSAPAAVVPASLAAERSLCRSRNQSMKRSGNSRLRTAITWVGTVTG